MDNFVSPGRSRRSIMNAAIARRAAIDALRKLNPIAMLRNPVMFVVEVGSVLTTVFLFQDIVHRHGDTKFDLQITLWLWFTVLFANFAEAMTEGTRQGAG
jgi:K+-transporting ATPase ATPase B chain